MSLRAQSLHSSGALEPGIHEVPSVSVPSRIPSLKSNR
jgi:hypothetical protein